MSNGKDFDKPEGRGRNISRERGRCREEEMDDIRERQRKGVRRGGKGERKSEGRKMVGMKERKSERERRGRKTKQTCEGCCTFFINKKIQEKLY